MRRDTLNTLQDSENAMRRYKGTFFCCGGGVLKGSNGKENLSDYKSLGLSQNLKRKDIFVRCTKPLCIHEMHNYHLIIINKSIILSITDRQKQN